MLLLKILSNYLGLRIILFKAMEHKKIPTFPFILFINSVPPIGLNNNVTLSNTKILSGQCHTWLIFLVFFGGKSGNWFRFFYRKTSESRFQNGIKVHLISHTCTP